MPTVETTPNNAVIAGLAEVSVAPVGTAMPTSLEGALDPAFVTAGLTGDKGVTINFALTQSEFLSHQSLSPYALRNTKRDVSADIIFLEWSTETIRLAFGGGTVAAAGGSGYLYSLPDASVVDMRAVVVDVWDNENHLRFLFPNSLASGNIKSVFVRTAAAELALNLKGIESGGVGAMQILGDTPGLISSSPVASIALTPTTLAKTVGQTGTVTALATLEDATTVDVTSIGTWSSSAPSKATVSSTGLVTAVATGSANITCSFEGVTSGTPCAVTVS